MSNVMDSTLREQINEASRVAEEFTKIYYDIVDKKKSIQKLYMDNGLLVYNGNGFQGESIGNFLKSLPDTSHQMTTLDAQPILDSSAGKSYLIQVSGTVKISNQKSRAFQQSFLITAQDNKWKIVTDTFRLQDGICGEIKL
ncbi:NTF2-related export protein [Chironomus tepperi]|uniref:NTF2-related export protein n=1 Tax=Chironomus tepperi TaxID=113505 RepID=UPI00391EEC59